MKVPKAHCLIKFHSAVLSMKALEMDILPICKWRNREVAGKLLIWTEIIKLLIWFYLLMFSCFVKNQSTIA